MSLGAVHVSPQFPIMWTNYGQPQTLTKFTQNMAEQPNVNMKNNNKRRRSSGSAQQPRKFRKSSSSPSSSAGGDVLNKIQNITKRQNKLVALSREVQQLFATFRNLASRPTIPNCSRETLEAELAQMKTVFASLSNDALRKSNSLTSVSADILTQLHDLADAQETVAPPVEESRQQSFDQDETKSDPSSEIATEGHSDREGYRSSDGKATASPSEASATEALLQLKGGMSQSGVDASASEPTSPTYARSISPESDDQLEKSLSLRFPEEVLKMNRYEFNIWKKTNHPHPLSQRETKALAKLRRKVLSRVYANRARSRRTVEREMLKRENELLRQQMVAEKAATVEKPVRDGTDSMDGLVSE